METLQSVPFPNLDVPGDESLYVRTNDRAHCELGGPRVRFVAGGELSTDTFYGGLTVQAWKREAPVRRLLLELAGEGEFVVVLGVHRLGQAVSWLAEHEVRLAPGAPVTLPVAGWDRLEEGMLFVRLRARGDAVLEAVRWRTDDPAPNEVRLGLVITHFNRQAQVLPAIRRLRRQVLRHPEIRGRATLTVVDNSRNLALADGDGVTYLGNRNFGGSGGFARGLLALEDDGRTTHCLFMDDDASCEGEAVLRTYALLRYAASPRLAVAGALVSESQPWLLLEKGARFDGKCQALHADRDLRRFDQLLWTERRETRPDYGGWWYFAFPIRELRQFPFPFFVRGDDVFFGLANGFEILTLNGIACLGEEFRVKHGPLTAYLDGRYHLLHAVLQEHGRDRLLRRLVSNQFGKPMMGYQYATARAFTLALRHVAQGPRFFRENLDLADVRAEIGRWQPAEKLAPIERSGLKLRAARRGRTGPEPGLRRVLRVLTLQGFLLPRAFLKDRVLHHEKSFHGRGDEVFGFRRVLYEHWPSGTGYVAEHDKRAFFRELRAFVGAWREFRRRLPQLQREYAEAVPQMASRRFWRDLYGLPAAATSNRHGEPAAPAEPPVFGAGAGRREDAERRA